MSSQAAQIRRNSFYSLLSSAIRLVTNFFLFIGIARFYGAETFGQFTTAHTFAIIFTLFADFGFDALLATEVSKQREQAGRLARQYLSIKFLFCLFATIAMAVIASVLSFSIETRILIYIFSFYVFFSSVNNFFFALFKGYEQLHHETRISFYINIFLFLLLIALGVLHVSIQLIAIIFVLSRVLGLILAIRTLPRIVQDFKFRFDCSGWREVAPKIAVFGVHYLFGNLFFQIDTLLLAFWKSDNDVGIYQSVFKLVALALVVPDVIISALMPTLSRFHGEQRERWNKLGELMYRTLFLIALPITLILFIYAEQIIHYLYGYDVFDEAIPILRIFAFTVFIRYCTETYALMLTTSSRQKSRMLIVVVATIINLCLNSYCITKYGIFGAAVVSLITNIAVGIAYILATENLFARWFLTARNLIPLSIGLVSGIALWNMQSIPFFYAVPVVIIFWGIVSYYAGFTVKERQIVFPFIKIFENA